MASPYFTKYFFRERIMVESDTFFFIMSSKLTLLLLPLLFISCVSVSNYNIQVLEPAPEPMTPEIKRVLLLNRMILEENYSEEPEGELAGDQIFHGLYNMATTETLFALAGILNESPGMDYLGEEALLEMPVTGPHTVPGFLDGGFIVDLCDSLGADALISLAFLQVDYKDSITLKQGVMETRWIAYYEGELDLIISAVWRAYEGSQGNLIDEFVFADTMYWSHAAFTVQEITDYFPTIDEAYLEAAFFSALKYARRVSPFWKEEQRRYFSRGNRGIKRASDYLENDMPDPAEEILTDLTGSRNANIVAAAYCNLALIYEIRGDYMEALKLARKSFHNRRHPVTESYIEILEERLEKSRVLDRQLGRVN
jgi:tetratricopeptide (TPR) repeat protein